MKGPNGVAFDFPIDFNQKLKKRKRGEKERKKKKPAGESLITVSKLTPSLSATYFTISASFSAKIPR